MDRIIEFWLLSSILRSPVLAFVILVVAYTIADRQFIGVLPDVTKPFRRNARIRSLRAEAERNPHNSAAMQELGLLLVEKGAFEEAADRLASALRRMPENANVRLGLGIALYNLGRYDDAIAEVHEAIRLNPRVGYGLPSVYLLKNQLRIGSVNDSAAIEALLERITSAGSPEVLYRSGLALLEAGDTVRAKRMFSAALANYRCFPGRLKKMHRRWALAAWIRGLLVR